MGIVLSHTIVSLFLHYRNRDRYDQGTTDQNSVPERIVDQEALSPLDNVAGMRDLYCTIREVLNDLLHRKVNSIVYIVEEKSGKLYADAEKKHAAPSSGIVRETMETQQFHVQSNDVAEDPVVAVLKAQCKLSTDWSPKTVYCLPVTDEENQKILALLVIEDNETVEINKITSLKHKIVGCYRRLCKCHQDSSSNYAPSNTPNAMTADGNGDKDAILRLCGDLYDQDASRLQLKVIRFLEEQTSAECAFLLLVVPETQDLFCQVIGGLVLEEEVKFPGQNSVFSLPLESKKPMKLEDVPLDKRKDIENLVGVKLKSMLCVPVSSRNNEGLIALACVVNKKEAENFTNDDLQAILQCFQYTSTVLTSTLAFQNERKLKLHTQAMLQVARNLFTHLGEFTVRHSEELASFNYLAYFLEKYKEQVSIPNKVKGQSKHKNSNGSAKACKSLPLADHRKIHVNTCKSSLNPMSGSLTYFASQFITAPREIVGSPNSERSLSVSYQKSNAKRRYFSSVYTEKEDFDLCARNEEFSQSLKNRMENSQLHSDCIDSGEKEISENEKNHYEDNGEVIQSDFRGSLNGVCNSSSFTKTGRTAKCKKGSNENDSFIDNEFIQPKVDFSIIPLQQELTFKDPELFEQRKKNDQKEGRNEVEIMDRIQEPVKKLSPKTDYIAAGNDSLLNTVKHTSTVSASNAMSESKTFTAEGEQCRVCVEIDDFKTCGELQPNEEAQLATSGSRSEMDESFTEESLLVKSSCKSGNTGSGLSSAFQSEVLKLENKFERHEISISDQVSYKEAVTKLGGDSECSDSCLPAVSRLHIAVTKDDDFKEGNEMRQSGSTDKGSIFMNTTTLNVPPEEMSQKSFHTAEDDAMDNTSVGSQGDLEQEFDMDEKDEKSEVFYDTLTDRSIFSSSSEQGMCRSIKESTLELKWREVKLSHSEPAISNVKNALTDSQSQFKDSKHCLNYAFIEDVEPFIDPLIISSNNQDSVVRDVGLICSRSSIPGTDIKIIVEDTTSCETNSFSHQRVPNISTYSSADKCSERSSGCSSDKHDKDLEYIKHLQPPATDVCIITKYDLTKLLREIMQEARNLTQAERCSVFLIDKETKELVAEVFDGISTNSKEEHNEIRMPITQGIAGHVATTGNLLNIKDAYSHPMFYRGIDDSTGFRTRNILCFPIKNEKGDVLGVAQLCNKKTGQHFTAFDEDLASAFAVYCCISISHSLMYQNVLAAQYRNSLANELMMYHMKISPDDVEKLLLNDIPSVAIWGVEFDKFSFPPREIPDLETPMCVLAMFEDLGFTSRWRIRKDTLVRFVLMVKKGYRNPPYHNWTHAFAVAHFCYLCITNLKLHQCLDDIELFALFVSCLCHDLDHRGTNNQYQVASKSVLAALYSSEGSVMERHHFAQTMCIVNTEGCNIFENLSSKDYTTVLDLVRDIILATDLAHHLKIMNSLKEMAKDGYDSKNERHHSLLLCLLMTASDLSDQTKPWDNTKHVAALIYREFFSQGDMEKSLGQKPSEMMDRERARIPDLQIGFLDHIALPVYKVLGDLFPAAGIVRDIVVDNRRHWEKICALIKIRRGGSCEQMSYDQILAMEEEEANAEIENYNLQNQKQNGR
ncbi:cGMP-dependent 3',5'-cyclic phosphodiesterase-like isoform X1 [Ostrea edulis]|uniref:cGMP-dependent 3',5'-cyclic phosphodiesterase-like isoform X1 n=1 Tax=Ostrea edulis TaxID=37623 RepID=UPI0024AE95D7|nr:cGMP-dependent 3',5'-cyclic phosphodiesterase-like isoform X1 [Ostrea edulis]